VKKSATPADCFSARLFSLVLFCTSPGNRRGELARMNYLKRLRRPSSNETTRDVPEQDNDADGNKPRDDCTGSVFGQALTGTTPKRTGTAKLLTAVCTPSARPAVFLEPHCQGAHEVERRHANDEDEDKWDSENAPRQLGNCDFRIGSAAENRQIGQGAHANVTSTYGGSFAGIHGVSC